MGLWVNGSVGGSVMLGGPDEAQDGTDDRCGVEPVTWVPHEVYRYV
jgi:hypothetical protein